MKSHDPASAIEDESTEGELKPSLNLRFGDFELRMKMATSEHQPELILKQRVQQ